eukprot:1105059-Pleurochrysis_carterae.AAC.1
MLSYEIRAWHLKLPCAECVQMKYFPAVWENNFPDLKLLSSANIFQHAVHAHQRTRSFDRAAQCLHLAALQVDDNSLPRRIGTHECWAVLYILLLQASET